MKYVIFFLISLAVGVVGSYLFLTYTSKKEVTKPVTHIAAINQAAFSIEKAPSATLRGTIASLSGEVLWQSRTATEGAKISTSVPLQQGESLATGKNGSVTFSFHSCQVTLSPSSKISIIQTLPTNIIIEQTAGIGSYTTSCGIPLAVRTGDIIIQKNSGAMTVTIDDTSSTIRIANLASETIVGFNDAKSVTTIVTVPEKSSYVFDTDSKTGTTRPLAKSDY